MRRLRASTLAITVGSLAMAGQDLLAAARPQAPVEDLLPASSYACVRFGGLEAAAHAADHMPAAALAVVLQRLPQELRQQFLEGHLDHAAEQVRQHCQQLGLEPATLRTVLGRPMAIGIGRLTIEGMGPSVALLVDCRQGRDEVHALAKKVLQLARAHVPDIAVDDVDIAGFRLHQLRRQNGDGPVLFAGDIGDFYVLSNSRGYLGEIGAVMASQQPCLAQASMLGEARHRLLQPALASLFLNTGPVLSMFEPQLPYEAAGLGKALGISNLEGLYAGAGAGADGGVETVDLGLAGDPHGLLKAAFSGSVDFEPAKWCGGDAVAFATGSFDVPAVVDAFRHLLEALPQPLGQHARAQVLRDLGRELRQHGLDGEQLEGLLRAFGHRVALAVNLQKGPIPLPEPLLFVEIADWQQVEPLLQQLQDFSARRHGLEWKTRKAGDAIIHYCEIVAGDSLRLSPCYVHQDGMLLLGTQVGSLLTALDQHHRADGSLYQQPDFAAAMQQAQGACGFAHLRWFRAAELSWRTVETMVGGQLDAHQQDIGFGSEVLPDQETVAKALGTGTMVVRVDAHGISMQSKDNFGFACMLAAVGRACDEVLHRASGRVF